MYELKKGQERGNRRDKTDTMKPSTICKIREERGNRSDKTDTTKQSTICKIRETTNDTMRQENICKIRDMTGDTMKQHTMDICDITKKEKTDGKLGNNKRDSMQHILQNKTKEKNGKNRREKINKKRKKGKYATYLANPKEIKN